MARPPPAQFSGIVRLTDLNDYIAPSQACVVAIGRDAAAAKAASAPLPASQARGSGSPCPFCSCPFCPSVSFARLRQLDRNASYSTPYAPPRSLSAR